MNKRIERISSYITPNDKVADIGCDQALLSEILAKNNIYSTASDIKENIVNSAKNRIKKLDLDNYVNFVISDGLENIDDSIDTLVLSGMGAYTILKIISKQKKIYKKIITISNNNHSILRVNMLNFGYEINMEEIIYERNKFYNLIVFTPGKCNYSEEEILLGKNHAEKNLFIKKIKNDIAKYNNIYKLSKDEKIKEKINVIEKTLKCH